MLKGSLFESGLLVFLSFFSLGVGFDAWAVSPADGAVTLSSDFLYRTRLPRTGLLICGFVDAGWRSGIVLRRGRVAGKFLSYRQRTRNYRQIYRLLVRRPRRAAGAARARREALSSLRRVRRFDPICVRRAQVSNPGASGQIPTPTQTPGSPSSAKSCALSRADQAEDISNPTTVVGNGTPESCTSDAFVRAVARGGVITFNCGLQPVTIRLNRTAKVFNDRSSKVVIDGGNRVTLSGGGVRRILYQNACDPDQVWTTPHCQNQDHPRLTVQNLTFVDGNAKGEEYDGGGAIFVRGGLFKVVNCRFFRNVCDDVGPDVGGGAIRVLSMYNNTAVPIVGSFFGGSQENGNVCSNGGALSSIGVSFRVLNSKMSFNRAVGRGANPARPATPGGGSGGAIYNDGNRFELNVCGSEVTDNSAREGGGAIFFVSNDRSGNMSIRNSVMKRNRSGNFETQGLPGIFVIAQRFPEVIGSVIE